jgi:ribosomal protein S27AE
MTEVFPCGPCGRELPRESFGIDRSKSHGRQSKCRECQRALSRRHYQGNGRAYRERDRGRNASKRFAHHQVELAMGRGDLARQQCERCGEATTVAHHDDYAKPLSVRWLCRSCHALWHAENGAGANA